MGTSPREEEPADSRSGSGGHEPKVDDREIEDNDERSQVAEPPEAETTVVPRNESPGTVGFAWRRDVALAVFGAVVGIVGSLVVTLVVLEPRSDDKSADSALIQEGISGLRSYLEICTQLEGVQIDEFERAAEDFNTLVTRFRGGASSAQLIEELPAVRATAEHACRDGTAGASTETNPSGSGQTPEGADDPPAPSDAATGLGSLGQSSAGCSISGGEPTLCDVWIRELNASVDD